MSAIDLIQTAERHLLQANEVLTDLKKNIHSKFGEYVVCDDGADRWLTNEDNWESALEVVIQSVLDGKFDSTDDNYLKGEAYEMFYYECWAYYSRIGSGSHNHRQGELIEMMSETMEDHEVKEIIEILGLGMASEGLPLVS